MTLREDIQAASLNGEAPKGPTTTVEAITPDVAEAWLTHNHANRRIQNSAIDRYAHDMKTGRWVVGGSQIVFDLAGNLLDGQNRLHACIRAETPFMSLVTRGVDPLVQQVIDTGKPRSLADLLSWRGESNVHSLGASITLSWKWATGRIVGPIQPTRSEALQYLDDNPSIREAVRRAGPVRATLMIPPSALATFLHQVALIDYEDSEAFINNIKDGEGLASGDATLALRNWCINQVTKPGSSRRPSSVTYLALLVRAWNAWITGKSVAQLRWRRGGSQKEEFPMLLNHDGEVVTVRLERDVRPTAESL